MTEFVSLLFLLMNYFSLSKKWQVLGPFPIGTREQDFGADPLEDYGNKQNGNSMFLSYHSYFHSRRISSAQIFF